MTENHPQQTWDKIYGRNEQICVWPWSDLVSMIMRHAKPETQDFRMLELGCGAGANIPFFLSLGVEYYAIESSGVIVSRLHKKFPELEDKIFVGDFTKKLPSGNYDLIVDRGSLTNNKTEAIENCLQLCHDQLKPNGKFVGIDWYSTLCSSYSQGQIEDDWTRINFPRGPFVDAFRVHFSDKEHLLELFTKFEVRHLELRTTKSEFNDDHPVMASWNLAATKK